MPHMSNLPWLSLYLLIALFVILFISKENITSYTPQNLSKFKSLHMNFKSWTW